jgi:hypothetical protein
MADELLPKPAKSPWLRRWRFRLAALGVALLTLIGFAPTIVARTALRSWVISRAAGDVRGSVHVGAASLGWLSEPELRDVELRDEQDRVIFAAPQVHIDRTLLGLALNSANLGTVTIDEPVISLVASRDDTNLEHALAAYIDGESTSPTRTAVHVVVNRARLSIEDQDIHQNWTAGELNLAVDVPADRKAAMSLHGQGEIQVASRSRKAELTLEYRSGRGGPGLSPQVHAEITTEGLPAAAVATFVRRFEPGLHLGGVLAGNLSLTWNDEDPDSPTLTLNGNVTGNGFSLLDPRLGSEPVECSSLEMPCTITWASSRLVADKTRIKSDFGEASLNGTIDLSKNPFAFLQTPGFAASCDIDLAKLSRLLPKQLRLQPGTKLTAGRLTGEVHSAAESGGVAWSGRLTATDLRGEHLGQPIAWENPVSIDFVARQQPDGLPRVDRFRLLSDFGKIEASGTDEQLTVGGNLDLALLARRLGQFIDLGGVKPAGNASAQVTLTREHGGAFGVKGDVRLRDLNADIHGRVLREPDLLLKLDAAGHVKGPAYRLESAGLHLIAGADHADFDLLEPIMDLAYPRSGYLKIGLSGDVGRWKTWAASLAGLPADWQAAGTLEASARVRLSPDRLEIDTPVATLNNFQFAGAGLNVVEPQVTAKPASVKFDRATGKIETQDLVIASSALGIRLDVLTVDPGAAGGLSASARGRLQGDASRLQHWLPSLSNERLSGTLDGTLELSAEAGRVRGSVEASVRSLVVGDPSAPTWSEPLVRVTARGRFDHAADLAVVEELKIESAALGGSASGRVAKLSTSADLLLTGQISYDLERWEPQLRHFLGKDARVAGRDRKAFRIEGSLGSGKPPQATLGSAAANSAAGLKGEGSLGWQAVQAYGCAVGPAAVQAKMLGDGWVRFDPVETTFNQGKLKLLPFIRVSPEPAILAFAKGTGVERAKLTSSMSDGSLGYVAPMLAGLRNADGEVSVMIDGGQIPLADPGKADVWGKIVIHSAKATPGPVLAELGLALRLPMNLSLSREVTIPFRVVNGRVYHKDLDLPIGEVTVRTSGSVGLDGTLSIVAEMTVPPRWLGKNAPKTSPTIKLPIGGTLSSPRIDEKALQQIVTQYTLDAAGDVLKREAEKGIRSWFTPTKK